MRLKFVCATVVAVLLYALAGCATKTSTPHRPVKASVTVQSACPPADGYMGCAFGAPAKFTQAPPVTLSSATAPAGVKFPDVSSYQGCDIDWATVGASGAAVKLGEGDDIVDQCAAHNIASLRAAHKAVVVYWFVRPDNAGTEAAYIVAALKAEKLTVSHVVIYTAPGTWPGGSSDGLDTWEAAYASVRPALPYASKVLAWQYTDTGHVSGLGYGDVSDDYGLLKLSPHVLVLDEEVPGIAGYAAPLAGYVLKHDPVPSGPKLPHPASYYNVFLNHAWKLNGRKLNERTVVEDFDRKPTKALQADLRLLANRLYHVSHVAPDGKPYRHVQWGVDHRGERYQRIGARVHQKL